MKARMHKPLRQVKAVNSLANFFPETMTNQFQERENEKTRKYYRVKGLTKTFTSEKALFSYYANKPVKSNLVIQLPNNKKNINVTMETLQGGKVTRSKNIWRTV